MKKIIALSAFTACMLFAGMAHAQTIKIHQIQNEASKAFFEKDALLAIGGRSGNPTDFDLQYTILPGKNVIFTSTLNQSEYLNTHQVYAFPAVYWCSGAASPDIYLGPFLANPEDFIANTNTSQADTVSFTVGQTCSNPNEYEFKYVVIGYPNDDTAGTGPLFWVEKIVHISFPPTMGIDNAGDAAFITVYPNPSADIVTIQGFPLGSTVALFDPLGRLVKTEVTQSDRLVWETSHLAPGLYTVSFANGAVKKLMVNH